jgi:hypothetical protein
MTVQREASVFLLFTYYYDTEIKESVMGWACSKPGETGNA